MGDSGVTHQDGSHEAVVTIDSQGRVLGLNSAAESTFGYARQAAVGQRLVDLIAPPQLHGQVQAALARFASTGEGSHLAVPLAGLAVKSDGTQFPIEFVLTPLDVEGQTLFTIHMRAVSERRRGEQKIARYQERLRALTAELLLAEERERRRLAIDLHDGLSQTIALVQLKLSALRGSAGASLSSSLEEIQGLVEQADRSARSITFELSPPVLHELGLEPAVEWLVEHIQERYGIEITLEDDGLPKSIDETTRVILFRSIRELLINAAKHARARRIHVRLMREEDCVDAAVEDDGIGMEPEAAVGRGTGLFSIRERMSHVGGHMHILSASGKGTKIRLVAPLSANGSKEVRT
jgi:PAS domain S-box-containing protein